jgi:hypothetical protein
MMTFEISRLRRGMKRTLQMKASEITNKSGGEVT